MWGLFGRDFKAPTRARQALIGVGADKFVLRELDGARHSSGKEGEGGGGFRIALAVCDLGQEAGYDGAEIVGGDALSREKER